MPTATKVQWRSAGQTFGTARERVVARSATEDTIPNLTPGTRYFVRVIATKSGASDGTPSNVESGTPFAVANRPPETTSQIATQFLQVGGSVRIDLSNHFRDPEGRTMRFSAVSDNTATVTVAVEDNNLTIRGIAGGDASVTVTARDNGGLTATQSFGTMVRRIRATDSPPALDLLAGDDAAVVDLTTLFTDAEGQTPTYAAESSDPELVTVSVEGTNLVLLPNEIGEGGTATVTVTAADADGQTTTLSFVIAIEPGPRGFLRGWRKALIE